MFTNGFVASGSDKSGKAGFPHTKNSFSHTLSSPLSVSTHTLSYPLSLTIYRHSLFLTKSVGHSPLLSDARLFPQESMAR